MARRRPAGRPGRRRPRARRRRGALVVGLLLLVWAGTPSVERRRRRRRRLGARDLEGLGVPLSAAGKAAAIVGGAIGLFLLLTLPFLVPNAATPPAPRPGAPCRAATRALPRRRDTRPRPRCRGSSSARRPHCSWSRRRQSSSVVGARRTSGGGSRCGGAGRPGPQAVARRPGVRARPAACCPARLRAHGGVARRDRALACVGRDPDRVHGPRPSSARASAAAASDLTGLFEIARFSEHPMDEDDRRRAIASVRRVEAEVARP